MKRLIVFSALFFIFKCGGTGVDDFDLAIPDSFGDWKVVENDENYDRETLYNYMNGGAELYLAFDYRKVFVRRFAGPEDNEIVLDIYDMGSSGEAFGIFSCDIEDAGIGIGQGSEFGAGLLRFWKDRFFVSIVAIGDENATESAMLEIAKSVDAAITTTGPEPEILKMLPQDDLVKNRISYFHSDISLNNRFFVASENILMLTNNTNCVFAEYGLEEENGFLLIVEYENGEQAQEAHSSFLQSYMPGMAEEEAVRTEDGRWMMAGQNGNFVAIVFEAPNKDRVVQLYSQIRF